MEKDYDHPGPPISMSTKIKCTLKDLMYFFTKSLWSKKHRHLNNTMKQEFLDCFHPLYWD